MTAKELYRKAIETYGKDMQLTVAVEEFSELIKEICKYKRGNYNISNIIEEMADCYIMLDQLSLIFGIKSCDVAGVMEEKTIRLEDRLSEIVKGEEICKNTHQKK